MMQRWFTFTTTLLLLATGCLTAEETSSPSDLRLATTTSMRDSGLLDLLLDDFEARSGRSVEYVAVGTGAALNLGRNGDVDALIVHAPEQEARFVEDGYGDHRTQIAWNAFVLLSPVDLPTDLDEALLAIVSEERCFVSRGDDSGTHMKEQELWQRLETAGALTLVEDSNGVHPEGEWYFSIGQGMGAAINMAHEKDCITLSDRGTALHFQDKISLNMVEYNDSALFNPYAFIPVSDVGNPVADELLTYLLNDGRAIIENYTINGQPAFFV
jgi:tungstate transport system substrate-binding protein